MFPFKSHFCALMAFAFLFSNPHVFGQKKSKNPTDEAFPPPVKFGVVTPDDFKSDLYAFDTAAPAVILFEKGYSYFKENKDGWFYLVFEKKQRIKIVNKNGMDAGNFVISQYKSGKTEEKIEKLVAVTYNLENDKVVQTNLNPSDIYKDQMSKTVNYLKFGLPAVKEGSIIEVSYTVISDFLFNLRSWNFQGEYPRVHSEYTTLIPDFFVYAPFKDGYLPFTHTSTNKNFKAFTIFIPGKSAYESSERISISTNETETRLVMQNVPAFKPEKFITTTSNYMSRVRYQLSEYRFPDQPPRPVMSTWPKLAEELLKDEEFGAAFSKNNGWLLEDIKKIINEDSTDLQKAKSIYSYWRTNFTLTSEGGKYMTDNPKNIWKNKKGNTADGNLMLTLLLKTAGLKADPFILSTRDNGWTNDFYPLINEYNYVVSKLSVDDKVYYLDATQPMLGFGFLPLECYNGHGRAINAMPLAEYLKADNVLESKSTYISMFSNEENPWKVNVSSRLGYYESTDLRETLKEKGEEGVLEQIKRALPAETTLENLKIKDEKELDKSMALEYDLMMEGLEDIDIIYLNPLLGEITKENPFEAAERNYPVEMPYAFRETIIANIAIPKGFVVDEMPKPTRVKLPDDMGSFDYLIQQEDGKIGIRCVIHIKQATFAPEAYEPLREFFVYIVKKQAEQIVLKRNA